MTSWMIRCFSSNVTSSKVSSRFSAKEATASSIDLPEPDVFDEKPQQFLPVLVRRALRSPELGTVPHQFA
jgi:hypothetical protein